MSFDRTECWYLCKMTQTCLVVKARVSCKLSFLLVPCKTQKTENKLCYHLICLMRNIYCPRSLLAISDLNVCQGLKTFHSDMNVPSVWLTKPDKSAENYS